MVQSLLKAPAPRGLFLSWNGLISVANISQNRIHGGKPGLPDTAKIKR